MPIRVTASSTTQNFFAPHWPKNWEGHPLILFDTHPIQYRTPIFRRLHETGVPSKVIYFNERFDGGKWWFHEVGKIPDQKWELSLKEGFKNLVLETQAMKSIEAYKKLRKTLIIEQPVAILIFGYYLLEHWMLWWVAQELRIPVIFVGETFEQRGSITRRALKSILQPCFFRGVSQFIAIGEKTREFYSSFKIDPRKIISARYCVDTSFFSMPESEAKKDRNGIRLQLGIPENAFVMLFVGRLFDRKRPQDMIALHKALGDSRVYTVIVGNGELEQFLQNEAGSIANLRMVGFKNQTETRAFYQASDCLVVPSEYETWGLVANEALASGVPAIVTDRCGVAGDLVIDGETGYVVPVGDIAFIAERVRRLKKEPDLRNKMSALGRKKAAKEYGIEQFTDAILTAVSQSRD